MAIVTQFSWDFSLLDLTMWSTPASWSTSHEIQQEAIKISKPVKAAFCRQRTSSCPPSVQVFLAQLAWPPQPSRRARTSMDHLRLIHPTTWHISQHHKLAFPVPTVTSSPIVLELGSTIYRIATCSRVPHACRVPTAPHIRATNSTQAPLSWRLSMIVFAWKRLKLSISATIMDLGNAVQLLMSIT